MKELSIEEKAKAYDNIIEKANKMHCENCEACQMCIEELIPELKESEGERIRKEIIDIINSYDVAHLKAAGLPSRIPKYISWLEKQGEQKSIDDLTQQEAMDIAVAKCFEQGEQKPVVIPKFRIGDIIKDTEDGEVFIIRTITKDKYIYTDDSFDWIKEQDKYELVEQKPAWSEEDEKILDRVITNYESGYLPSVEKRDKIIEKLESLKGRVQPQNTWKPSDEQIHWLKWAINRMPDTEIANEAEAVLEELLEQLKKLREE